MMAVPIKLGTKDFYKHLKPIKDYKKICDLGFYQEVPADWSLILCDIKDSTRAIKAGKYKEVNFVGAACIMSLVNKLKDIKVPYVFGGDGATLLVPNEAKLRAGSALWDLQTMAQNEYGLELRVGLVSIAELQMEDFSFKVSKLELSEDLSIALFMGNGFSEAERRVKSVDAEKYLMRPSDLARSEAANLEGLECRWESFKSSKGEILTVLVKAFSKNPEDAAQVYQEVIEEIEVICGSKEESNPTSLQKLKLTKKLSEMNIEKKARTAGASFIQKNKYLLKMFIESIAGSLLMNWGMKAVGVDWGLYKKQVVQHSDYWKFDDTLRFVFDVSGAQKRALLSCLELKKRDRKLFYGTHSSSAALMTCLIFDRQGEHVHFMDGADGGYALAAVQLKEEIKVF